MSNGLVTAAITVTHSDVAPDSLRYAVPAVTELVAGPRPAFGHPYAMRLSDELVAVLTHWLQHPRERFGPSRSHPEYRRYLP
jgi:hypothetical protein